VAIERLVSLQASELRDKQGAGESLRISVCDGDSLGRVLSPVLALGDPMHLVHNAERLAPSHRADRSLPMSL